MQLRTRTWFVISLLCFLVAAVFWQLGERKAARDKAAREAGASPANAPTPAAGVTTNPPALPAAATNAAVGLATNDPLRLRLSNTTKSADELSRSDQGVLLRNAHIDSALPVNLPIPAHLRSQGDPGSYVVQSRGLLTDAYRALLRQAGAEIVAYVPNNAYLVRASAAAAQQLAASPQTQAVLPWEPYYKLDTDLLELAVEQKPLPNTEMLNVLIFSGERQAVEQALAAQRAVVVAEDRSPFGVQLVVRPRLDGVVPIAQLPGVQAIELYRPRKLANDLTRARLRVSTNTITLESFRSLTGEGVLVNVNDTGVQEAHPDLTGRVFGDSPFTLEDFDGHGTHVAGTIASSGANGPTIPPRRIPGSTNGANFRGMAPGASIYALPLSIGGPLVGDSYFQENAAKTNAFISNNSWGYLGSASYNLSAASWDAAVRDALPGVEGPQPILPVFAAGNSGTAGIDSPGTAKNVITVGALENPRFITNVVTVIEDGITNRSQPWLGMTDTNNQVADFSSTGNVGRRREGESGRFKPDVVAPGTFVVSTRSSHWVQPTNLYSVDVRTIPFVSLDSGESDTFSATIPRHAISLEIETRRNRATVGPGLPPINIYVQPVDPPVPPAGFMGTNRVIIGPPIAPRRQQWFFTVENPGDTRINFDVRVTVTSTNNLGDEPEMLFKLNEELAPYYRYESGTSMSAPAVSGVLALMQEYYLGFGLTNSPALMKALLINGARSANPTYDFNVAPTRNRQGWGLVNLTNNLPNSDPQVTADQSFTSGTMLCFDQNVRRALATGQSYTRVINVDPTARAVPLRFTLVWTDPPGNPAVGVKLVNDLDLIVTNMATKAVYVGNNIGPANVFTFSSGTNITNTLAFDRVNNVENVYLNGSFSQRLTNAYSVTVVAHRVNVNAVTTHPDGVVQDFALVIASGDPRATTVAGISLGTETISDNPLPEVTIVTNGFPLLNQRAGGSRPQLVSTNGVTNQWHFFLVTNALPPSDPAFTNARIAAATNIAFATFLPPNLSLIRTNGSDVDLYVSLNPALTNLDPAVIATSRRSVRRGGTEAVVLVGAGEAVPGAIFYAGVKCEDQEGANFGFFAVSSSRPFASEDTNGVVYLEGYPFNIEVPDGTPAEPMANFMFAFYDRTRSTVIQNVVVTNYITHTNGGDLFGSLNLDGLKNSVLNANRAFSSLVPLEFIYNDADSGEHLPTQRTDTPGTLRNFVGETAGFGSVMRLTMVDSAPGDTGQVNSISIRLDPRPEDLEGFGALVEIRPGFWFRTVVDVPADATNLLVCVAQDEWPLEVYIARGYEPDRNTYDAFAAIAPPGDCLSLGPRDVPPLSQGRYFIGVFNPNQVVVNARIRVQVQRDLSPKGIRAFRADFAKNLLDDARTNSTIFVSRAGTIADVSVGVRIAHPRVSDLVLHVTSPQGTRLLLAENRGDLTADYGFGSLVTNVVPVSSTGGAQASTNVLGLASTEGVLQVSYQHFGVPDRITVYYDNALIFDSGYVSGSGTFSIDYGPGASTNIVIVMNEGTNPNLGTLWQYTATVVSGYTFATFTDNTNFTTVPIKFAIPPFTNFNYFATNFVTNAIVLNDGFEDPRPLLGNDTAQLVSSPSFVSGWSVDYNAITLLGTGGTNAPWLTAPHTGVRYIDINDGIITTNFPTTPGLIYQGSFCYTHNPTNPNPTTADIFLQDTNNFLIDAFTVTAPIQNPPGQWLTNFFTFQAISPVTQLQIVSTTPNPLAAVLFDSFRVEHVTENVTQGIYYQPEEPLTERPFGLLVGQEAFGPWTLDIWDNRAGGALTNGSLLAWKLNITYVNTNPPTVALTNGLEFCSTLRRDEIAYFLFNVPISARAVTNIVLASENVDLIYNAVGLPRELEPPDTYFLTDEQGGTAILDGGGWNSFDQNGRFLGGSFFPQLRPGFRYYLAVRNRYPGTNAFCIRVQADNADPTLIPIIHIAATNVPPCEPGFIPLVGDTAYYSFDVGSNAIGAEFSISNIVGGDVHLYVKRRLPVPSPTQFFARSENAGLADEFIQVADFTGTLLPGRWYLAAVAVAGTPSFDVCAREIPGPITPLAVNVTNYSTVNTSAVHYYKVVIASNAFQADFRLIAGASNVDLFISQSEMTPLLTSPTNAAFASTNANPPNPLPGDELITLSVFTNSAPLTPGTWYLAVVNKETMPVNYCLVVNQFITNINYITLTNGVPYMDQVAPGDLVGFYRFDVATNALQVVFDTFGANGDVDLYVRYGFPLPPPGTNQFQFASTSLLTTNEWIGLHVDNTNALPRPGSYWIAVVAKNPALTINYKVRATQILRREVTNLVNGVAVCQSIQPVDTNALHSGVHFYRFDVGSNAVQALFETFNADGNVDLYLQYGLPITNYSLLMPPSRGNFTNSENAGLTNESICLLTNSSPIALRSGTWYIAVVNRETNDVNYCLRASAVSVRPLANGVMQCDFLNLADGSPVNGIRFYSFNVASNAVQTVFETLFVSRNVDLYVRKAPTNLVDCGTFTANLSGWTYASTNAGSQSESICLLTNSAPEALSAGNWYVAVVNRDTNRFAGYCVRATQLLATNFTAVTNGQTACRTVGVGNGAMNAGIDYLLLTVTNGPVLMSFETFDATGNVDLFVGLADTNLCLPNFATFNPALTNYPYASVNLGRAPECVMLETNTAPIALTNGVWYVAVVNRAFTPVDYCFLATEFATNPSVRLTNGVAACSTVPPTNGTGGIGVNYYVFNVSTNALRATFETFNANGNVDIYLQYGFCFPHRNVFGLDTVNGAYASTNSGPADEFICLDGASFPAPLKPGDWYVAVVNREAGNVSFCVRVTELIDSQVLALTNGIAHTPTNALAVGGTDFYRYGVSTNAVQVNFEVLQMTANVDLFVDYGFCSSNALTFSYASTNGGTTNELIVVATNATPVPLAPGDWIIAVKNNDAVPAGYTVRVTEVLASDIIRLTNAVPYTNTVAGLGSITNFPVNYYVFNVSTNAVRAQFEVLAPSGDVSLVARKGLPLPTLNNTSLASTNPGTSAELIVLFTNSMPVALTPGDWFLSVLNTTTNAATYAVVATEYASAGTNVSIAPGGISLVSNLFCLTWTNTLPGVNYYVQGKATLNDPAWVPVSPTIRATTNFITWCIQLPSPYHFFRLVEGLSPVSVGGQLAYTAFSWGTNGFSLSWTAPPNQRYVAEWTPTFAPPAWRPFPDYITSTNTAYTFTDDGSKTGGLGTNRFYRFFLVP